LSLDTVVFALAISGYASLGLSTILYSLERGSRLVAWLTALVVASHVLGVWAHRFGWSLTQATENGWRGFFLFHLALLVIVTAPLLQRYASLLTHTGFVVVTGGALGAVFKYDFVFHLRLPVLLVACTTLIVAGIAHVRAWRERRA
jgi:hypothetical protein